MAAHKLKKTMKLQWYRSKSHQTKRF